MKETRLAAVMFTDIAGFSEKMERDEKGTIDLLDEHNQIILPLIANFTGTVIDSIGDGLLVTFDSVLSAVSCGLNIQNAVAARNEKAEDNSFYLRIGIHMGDIWVEGDRIYGNGVNIASRIQNLARPGGICISEDVYYQVKNKEVIRVEEIPSPSLKNISREMRIFHLITGRELAQGDRVSDSSAPAAPSPRDAVPAEKPATTYDAGTSEADDGDDFGSRLEERIGNFVEKTIEVALGAWDNTPKEVKTEVLDEIRKEDWYVDLEEDPDDSPLARKIKGKIRSSLSGQVQDRLADGTLSIKKSGDDKSVSINLGGSPIHIAGDGSSTADDASPVDKLPTVLFGLISTIGFQIGIVLNGSGWFWFLFFAMGVLPLLIGSGELIKAFAKQSRRRKKRLEEIEKKTLECARENGGRLTVVQLAHCTGFSMDEAQKELDRLSGRNWVQQNFSEEGVLYYEFPSLLPPEAPL